MYLNRNRFQYDDWYCVVIFPDRSLEPSDQKTHRIYLNSDQVQRIYLDELGDPSLQPIGINLMQLTLASDETMAEQARLLIERVELEETGTLPKNEILEVITTIAVYKFSQLSREEVEAMLGLSIEETRIYKDLERQTKLKIVPELLSEGLSVEKVAKILNLPVESVINAGSVKPEQS